MQAGSGSKGKATFVFRDQSYSWSNIKVLSFLWIVFSCPAITKSSKVSTEIVMQMSSVLNLMSFLWNLLPLAFTNLMPLHWHPYLMKCFDWSCAFVWCSLHPDNGSYMQMQMYILPASAQKCHCKTVASIPFWAVHPWPWWWHLRTCLCSQKKLQLLTNCFYNEI